MTLQTKTIIFDFDGTLVDTLEVIVKTWTVVCENYDLKVPSKEHIKSLMGVSLPKIAEEFGAENININLDDLVKFYKQEFSKYENKIKLFVGTKSILDQLTKLNIQMHIVSARSSLSLNNIIKYLEIDKYFVYIVGSDDVCSLKPNPEAIFKILQKFDLDTSQVYMVGDAEVDIRMGNSAGVKTVFVTWGALKPDKLKNLNLQTDYIIKHPSELIKIF